MEIEISKAVTIVWVVILASLLGWELWVLWDGKPHTLTLTRTTVTYAPGVFVLGFIGWLFVHFLIRYVKTGNWWF